jgi:hypothetical protein
MIAGKRPIVNGFLKAGVLKSQSAAWVGHALARIYPTGV